MISFFRQTTGILRGSARNAVALANSRQHAQPQRLFSDDVTEKENTEAGETEEAETAEKYKFILTSVEDKVMTIEFNRPDKFNSITFGMYGEICDALEEARASDDVNVAVLTGKGPYYSAGNDLTNFTRTDDKKEMALEAGIVLRRFVDSFIRFPKPLIAAVNGHAVGIPVTTLGLCDLVYAKEGSTFHTPFAALGQSPEGCSSYIFPRVLGPQRAKAMLLQGKKFGARELESSGLITKVFSEDEFEERFKKEAKKLAALPPRAVQDSKFCIMEPLLPELNETNERECLLLEQRWQSDECAEAVAQFLASRK